MEVYHQQLGVNHQEFESYHQTLGGVRGLAQLNPQNAGHSVVPSCSGHEPVCSTVPIMRLSRAGRPGWMLDPMFLLLVELPPYSHHANPISILTQPHMKLMEKNHSGFLLLPAHLATPAACPKLGDLNPLHALPALWNKHANGMAEPPLRILIYQKCQRIKTHW